jgi:hypothetical protein
LFQQTHRTSCFSGMRHTRKIFPQNDSCFGAFPTFPGLTYSGALLCLFDASFLTENITAASSVYFSLKATMTRD